MYVYIHVIGVPNNYKAQWPYSAASQRPASGGDALSSTSTHWRSRVQRPLSTSNRWGDTERLEARTDASQPWSNAVTLWPGVVHPHEQPRHCHRCHLHGWTKVIFFIFDRWTGHLWISTSRGYGWIRFPSKLANLGTQPYHPQAQFP